MVKTKTDDGFYLIFLHVNVLFINADRTNLPTLEAFINNSKFIYEMNKHVHLMDMTYDKFIKK